MKRIVSNIYGGHDPIDLPAYNIAEAARYLRIAPATLRSWIVGRSYPRGGTMAFFEPLIRTPGPSSKLLSFSNLIEAHILRALRVKHNVSIKAVRIALDFAEREFSIKRLLLRPELRTDAGDIFLIKYGELINLSKAGQLAIKKILEDYLKRIEWDVHSLLPLRLFPFLHRSHVDHTKVIAIDPLISFGRPVIWGKNISTAVIADRIDTGESVAHIADDYNLDTWMVEEAVIYERAA